VKVTLLRNKKAFEETLDAPNFYLLHLAAAVAVSVGCSGNGKFKYQSRWPKGQKNHKIST